MANFIDTKQEGDVASETSKALRLVLIDDCSDFRDLMRITAERNKMKLEGFDSLADMNSIGRFRHFDIALIDFHLESWCGLEIASYIDVFFQSLPVLIVSADAQVAQTQQWPASVCGFVAKSSGPEAILRQAQKTVKEQHYYRKLRNRAFGTEVASPPLSTGPESKNFKMR